MSTPTATRSRRISRRPTVTTAGVARLVLVPLTSVAIIVFLCVLPAQRTRAAPANGIGHVGLVEKDSTFHIVAAANGGAFGDVAYTISGPRLEIALSAAGLRPGIHYLVELNVDGTTYEVTSRAADRTGRLVVDTVLTRFDSGVCNGGDYVPPQPLRGSHRLKFLVKRDGNPPDGTKRARGTVPDGVLPALPCRGNGDNDFSYALFEDNVARFHGTR